MKNKNGFTLIELLAVIILISVILGIATLNAIKYYNQRKEVDYNNIVSLITDNTKVLVNTDKKLSKIVDYNLQNSSTHSCKLGYHSLVTNKLMDKDTKNPKTGELLDGYVIISLNKNYEYGYVFKDTLTSEEEQISNCIVDSVITFNANGGTGGPTNTLEVAYGDSMPSISEIPTRDGYIFKGWYDNPDGGTRYYTAVGKSAKKWNKTGNETLYAKWSDVICRRAASNELHGSYGHVGTSGQLAAGDAFVCDVNADEIYDAKTEMFYYVSDYYTMAVGAASGFDSSYAVFVYSNNTNNGVLNNTSKSQYDMYPTNQNGPATAKTDLPSESQWPGVKLKNSTRYLQYKTGGYYREFSYSGYSSRLLTFQEFLQGCPTHSQNGIVCSYLLENGYSSSNSSYVYGYWLESAENDTSNNKAWGILISNGTNGARTTTNVTNSDVNYGVRPVIEVQKTNIDLD